MLAACMFPMAVLLQSQLLGFGAAGAAYLMLIQLGEIPAAGQQESVVHIPSLAMQLSCPGTAESACGRMQALLQACQRIPMAALWSAYSAGICTARA
jgi:hypothetical protein